MSPYDIVIQFRKPFIKCLMPLCKNKHYARGYCQQHYNTAYRSEYPYSLKEYQKADNGKQKKDNTFSNPLEGISKHTNFLYQEILKADIKIFGYKDIMKLTGWGYEKIKRHILKLVAINKIKYIKKSTGGKQRKAIFTLLD